MIRVKPLIWENKGDYYFTAKPYGFTVTQTHGMGPKAWMATSGASILGYRDTAEEAREVCEDHHVAMVLATVEEVDR